MTSDIREGIYRDLHGNQLTEELQQTVASARRILGILFEYIKPDSVLDVGCGLGAWLSVASEMGVKDVHGIEGHWLDPARACIDAGRITRLDLEAGFALGRRFDLAVCLEVAEHLPAACADRLVASLTEHSSAILFSAAIPSQGGTNHVNEQFPSYWAAHFERRGFRPADMIRGRIWNDESVLWWLRQNTLVFAHDSLLATNDRLRRESEVSRPLNLVLPGLYLLRVQQGETLLREHRAMEQLLAQGGTFTVTRSAENQLTVRRNP